MPLPDAPAEPDASAEVAQLILHFCPDRESNLMLAGPQPPASALTNMYVKLPGIYRDLERSLPAPSSNGINTPDRSAQSSSYATTSTAVQPFHPAAAFESSLHSFSITPSQNRLLQAASLYLPKTFAGSSNNSNGSRNNSNSSISHSQQTPSSSSSASSIFTPQQLNGRNDRPGYQLFPPSSSQTPRGLSSSMESSRTHFRGRSNNPAETQWDTPGMMTQSSSPAGRLQPTSYPGQLQQHSSYRNALVSDPPFGTVPFPAPGSIRQSRETAQGNEGPSERLGKGSANGGSGQAGSSSSRALLSARHAMLLHPAEAGNPTLAGVTLPQLQRQSTQNRSRKDLLTSLSANNLIGSYVTRQNPAAAATQSSDYPTPPRPYRHSLPSGLPTPTNPTNLESTPNSVRASVFGPRLGTAYPSLKNLFPSSSSPSPFAAQQAPPLSPPQATQSPEADPISGCCSQEPSQHGGQQSLPGADAVEWIPVDTGRPLSIQTDRTGGINPDRGQERGSLHDHQRESAQVLSNEKGKHVWLEAEGGGDVLRDVDQDMEQVSPFNAAEHGSFPPLPGVDDDTSEERQHPRVSRAFRYTSAHTEV
ncbi:MAG: hypothetical protein WDW36_003226 [Sanguina aurantia]